MPIFPNARNNSQATLSWCVSIRSWLLLRASAFTDLGRAAEPPGRAGDPLDENGPSIFAR